MAGALLSALRAKGVTADEVRGFAGAMRALALKPALPRTASMPSTSSAPAAMGPAA